MQKNAHTCAKMQKNAQKKQNNLFKNAWKN